MNLEHLLVWLGVLLLAGAYVRGTARLWRRGGVDAGVRRAQALSFLLGLNVLLVALASPLDGYAHVRFSAHMTQHVLLMLVAAPLLVYGAPLVPLLWSLPRAARLRCLAGWRAVPWLGRAWQTFTHPLVVWALGTATLWLWHLPSLYQAALVNPWLHALEHASFLVSALLFWWLVIQPHGRRLSHGLALLLVFGVKLQSGALGAIITFAPAPLYPAYEASTALFGLSALEDQHLAGLIMSTPGGIVYLVTGALLFLRWLRVLEQRAAGQPARARRSDRRALRLPRGAP